MKSVGWEAFHSKNQLGAATKCNYFVP